MRKQPTTSFVYNFPKSKAQWLQEEDQVYAQGFERLCGVDEVGRGCLAGPVVACAIVLPPGYFLEGVDDSKKLSAPVRRHLAAVLMREALEVKLSMVTASEIDQINILKASFKAMQEAVAKIHIRPDFIFVDGHLKIPNLPLPQRAVVKGDGRVFCIAAASIVAKVVRDRLMNFYARQYPGYGFESHKGYGTLGHRQAMVSLGPCRLHRSSFAWQRPEPPTLSP